MGLQMLDECLRQACVSGECHVFRLLVSQSDQAARESQRVGGVREGLVQDILQL